MQNGHSDPEALLSQLRSEVRKRKLALGPSTSPDQISQPEVNPPVSSIPETVPPAEVTQALAVQAWDKPRLKRARGAIDRASMKNESVRRWPRFLRGIRRNQGAVNESLIRGINAVLETLEWFHRRFAALDSRLANQDSRSEEQQRHLVEFRRVLELRARQIAEQEERTEQHSQQLAELDQKVEGRRLEAARQEERTEQHSQQLAELDQKVEGRRLEAARQEERTEQHSQQLAGLDQKVEERTKQHRQQLEALDRRLEQQARRAVEAEQLAARQGQQLAELERDVEDRQLEASKEEKRVTEQHRLLGEQQRQLLELSYKLVAYQTDIGARFERAAAQQLSDKRQLLEVKSFIREQEKQTIEEHRQLSELARRLAEHQEIANARWQKRAEQRQEDGRRLSELQEFVNAQHRQNTDHSRLLEEQQRQMAQVREILEQSSQRLEGTAERALLHDQTLKEMQTFVTAQQEQTTEEQRQFSDLQEFVRQQQDQTAEEQRQFTEQRKQLEEFGLQLVEYRNDLSARYHLTGEEIEQQKKQTADMQEFVNAQHRQNAEDSRLLEDQQVQLAKVRETLEQSSQRLEGTAERVLLQDQTWKEMQTFVTAQQEQTAEEQRQFSYLQEFVRQQQEQTAEEQRQFTEQRKQLEVFSRQLVEYQNDVCARYHLTGEDIEQQKRQLADMQEFVNAQEKQTREEERQLQEQQAHLVEIRAGVEEWRAKALADTELLTEIERLRDRLRAMQGSFAIIQRHLASPESCEMVEAIAPSLSDELKKHETDAFYLAFENEFRGDRELIKERSRFYLPIIDQIKTVTGNAAAVDLGCGRGEWLELLREYGYEGVGVDLNECMVEECRVRGLKAESADGIAYLRGLPAGSLSLVTGFHLVEHLSFSQLFELFRETLRVLCLRGTAIFETPNPECLQVASYNFFLDPTHRNPIPQELLSFVATQVGFAGVRVERLHPYYEEGVFKGHGDYAGVFTK